MNIEPSVGEKSGYMLRNLVIFNIYVVILFYLLVANFKNLYIHAIGSSKIQFLEQ